MLLPALQMIIAWHIAGQQDIQHDARTPHINFGVIHLLIEYLGCLIVHGVPRVHFPTIVVVAGAEVTHLYLIKVLLPRRLQQVLLLDQQVVQTDISMNNFIPMHFAYCHEKLLCDVAYLQLCHMLALVTCFAG